MSSSQQVAIKPFFSCSLSLPPGVNQSYKIVSIRSHRVSYNRLGATEALESFKQLAHFELSQQAIVDWQQIEAIKSSRLKVPLSFSLKFYFPALWRRDVDSGVKAVQDVIFTHLGLNDDLVTELHVSKDADKERPHVEAELRCVIAR
jgi:Holliday junction resolvase RusA-like endonuclease